jgi:hypothetical protein
LLNGARGGHAAFDASRILVSPIMSALVAATDWARTPLGPAEDWPLELRTILDVVLGSRFPMVFWWGPDLIQVYNDAYLPIMGGKHPAALGQTARDCWSEIWDAIGPQLLSIQNGGPATWNEDVLLDINRHGFVGESYFTWSYSPLPQSDARNGIGGILCTVQETTEQVIGERRILLLRDLAAHGTDAKSAEDECRVAAATLERFSRSVPFSLIYLIDETGSTARLAAASGVDLGDPAGCPQRSISPATGPGPWRVREALADHRTLHIPDLSAVVERIPAGRGRSRRARPSSFRSSRACRTSPPACSSPASTRANASMSGIAASTNSSQGKSALRSRAREPMRTSGGVPKRWRSWIASRSISSPTSATSFARRSR